MPDGVMATPAGVLTLRLPAAPMASWSPAILRPEATRCSHAVRSSADSGRVITRNASPVAWRRNGGRLEAGWRRLAGGGGLAGGWRAMCTITTHVLDSALGLPAAGVPVALYGDAGQVAAAVTDADG